MRTAHIILGRNDWSIRAFYDIHPSDLGIIYRRLLRTGARLAQAAEACRVLSGWNKGYTFTNHAIHTSVLCAGRATSPDQLFDTLIHELKHVVESISSHYDLDPQSERAAYLQGEIARQFYLNDMP